MLQWRRRRVLGALWIIVGCLLLASLLVFWTEPLAAFAVLDPLTPHVLWRVKTDRPLVGLSFDDGPHPIYTPRVLEILKTHDARATFFLIGERALAHSAIVQDIKAAGHEVGNHYFVDQTTLGQSDSDFEAYLERTEKAVGIAAPGKLFRPPGGIAWPGQLRLARQRGYSCVLGSAYPHDPAHPPVWYIQWLVEKNLAPGTIIILHDGIRDPTRGLQALPQILSTGKARGLRFVSIGELIRTGERRP